MNKRLILQTVLVVLALLMPAYSDAQPLGKKLIDSDIIIKEFLNGGDDNNEYRGHITVVETSSKITMSKEDWSATVPESYFKITIPAFTSSSREYKVFYPAVTIEGKCLALSSEAEGFSLMCYGKPTITPNSIIVHSEDEVKFSRASGVGGAAFVEHIFADYHYVLNDGSGNTIDYTKVKNADIIPRDSIIRMRIFYDKMTKITKTIHKEEGKDEETSVSQHENYNDYFLLKAVVLNIGKIDNHAEDDDSIDSPVIHEEDNEASEESGIEKAVKYLIPATVAAAVTGVLARRRKKNKEKKERERRRQEEEYYEDDDYEDEEEEEEDEEEEDQLEMEIYKDFGDTLTVGDAAQWVYVCIMRKNSKSPEWTDLNLTRQIKVEGDGYLSVEDGGIKNDWKCVAVGAPKCEGEAPAEGYVKFTLANEDGSYVNRIHFKIVKGAIIFDPDLSNVTIPAHFQQPVSVPFEVVGIDEKADMELTVTMEDANGNITSDYDVELDPRNPLEDKPNYAIIHDRKLDEKTDYLEAGTHLSYVLHVRASSGEDLVIDGYMPVFRYYMGLSLKVPDGGVGCYVEEYNPEKHFIHSFFKVDGKQFARCQTKCFVKIYDYDLEKHCILAKEPHPDNIDLKVEGVGDDVKDMLDRINLSITGVSRGEEGFYYFLFCRTDVLAPPNRLAVLATLTVKDGENKYVVKQLLNLWSQPRRSDLTPEQMQAAIKRDDELEARLLQVDNKITEIGLRDDFDKFLLSAQRQQEGIDTPLVISDRLELFGVDRFHKLLKSIEILRSTRDSKFGYDEDSVVAVETLFHCIFKFNYYICTR